MIAKISNIFGDNKTLKQKIAYNIAKIEAGKGEYLYDNFGENNIEKLFAEMKEVGEMNNRVEKKYFEVSLNLIPGEKIDNEKFLIIAQDYLKNMGYEDCCYGVIRHTDREHQHLHILCTTVDYDGNHVSDSYTKLKSQNISRGLEVQYNLEKVEYSKFNNQNLSKIKEREYYFSNALYKGLRDFSTKNELSELLSDDMKMIQNHRMTNEQLEIVLGKERYTDVGNILEKNNHFTTLYKEELLQKLDLFYTSSNSKHDFFEKIHAAGLYVRTVSDKGGELKYTYGLPSINIYFKDDALPQKYRYSSMDSFISPGSISVDVQKSSIASKAIVALKNSTSFESYLLELDMIGIVATVHQNSGGVYGMSFQLKDIENAIVIKASEITSDRGFSFSNITKYFNGEKDIFNDLLKNDRVGGKGSSIPSHFQKQLIRSDVRAILPKVKNLEELSVRLSDVGISLWVRKSRAGAIQGFSFKMMNCRNAVAIKAKDICEGFDKEMSKAVQGFGLKCEEEIRKRYENFTGLMSSAEQKEYIRIVAQANLKLQANDVGEFSKLIKANGISFTVNKIGNLTKGFSFKMQGRGEALTIKASSISKELNAKLVDCFASNEVKITIKSTEAEVSHMPPLKSEPEEFFDIGFVISPRDNYDDLSKRKKKKKKKKSMDMDFGM